jgi:hypothetical protein
MSSADLKRFIEKELIPVIKKDLRTELNTMTQYVSFPSHKVLKDMLKDYYEIDDDDLAKKMASFVLKDIKSRSSKSIVKTKIKGKVVYMAESTEGGRDNYAVLKKWKTAMSDRFAGNFEKHITVSKTEEEKTNKKTGKTTTVTKTEWNLGGNKNFKPISQFLVLGHGGQGTIAAVGQRTIKAMSMTQGSSMTSRESKTVLDLLGTEPKIRGFKLSMVAKKHLTTNSEFKGDYKIALEVQSFDKNAELAAEEKALYSTELIAKLINLAELKTSPSAAKMIENALERAILGKKAKGKKFNSKASSGYTNKKKGKKPRAPSYTPRLRDTRGRFTSAANIQQLIQAQIVEKVKENMGEGGSLVNRTGRFAESVTINSVTQSRQGTLTAFYNYMKYPYQTFERGFKQGSTRRDPRLLIHKSIREIAITLVHHKLNIKTRRV